LSCLSNFFEFRNGFFGKENNEVPAIIGGGGGNCIINCGLTPLNLYLPILDDKRNPIVLRENY
jgi:hypothetical protein